MSTPIHRQPDPSPHSAIADVLLGGMGGPDQGGIGVRVGLCSWGLAKLEGLPVYTRLPAARFDVSSTFRSDQFDLYIGWGRKRSGRLAMQRAEARGKPFLLLEDAFIRSVFPAKLAPAPAIGLVLDDCGIHYDGSCRSRLEHLIAQASGSPEAEAAGRKIIKTLKGRRLSKYNHFVPLDPDLALPRPTLPVLVADQTLGDCSATDRSTFARMLEAAVDENPRAEIWIKPHPEAKAGHYDELASRGRVRRLLQPHNPWDLFGLVSKVYTVSSQLGFEALLAGLEVRCFGLPFYAGWGLTGDERSCLRRRCTSPSVAQIAHAAYNQYSRYRDPYQDRLVDFDGAVEILTHVRTVAERTRDMRRLVSIYPWYRRRVREIFQAYRPDQKFDRFRVLPPDTAGSSSAAWASRIKPKWDDRAKTAGMPLWRIEDGFLRSAGLGANFHMPLSLVLDRTGIHYDARWPSDLENILASADFDAQLLQRAHALIKVIRQENICKYNSDSTSLGKTDISGRPLIFVPGQVEDDASVKFSGSAVQTNLDLLTAVRSERPGAFILYKPHPDVVSGHRRGSLNQFLVRSLADRIVTGVPIGELIDACDEVHTISSLTGFFALIRKRRVVCHGLPFYAGWGLTHDKLSCPRRRRVLTLDQLVAAALIIYPFYVDPVSSLPCSPEVAVQRIREMKQRPHGAWLVQFRQALGHLRRLQRYAVEGLSFGGAGNRRGQP